MRAVAVTVDTKVAKRPRTRAAKRIMESIGEPGAQAGILSRGVLIWHKARVEVLASCVFRCVCHVCIHHLPNQTNYISMSGKVHFRSKPLVVSSFLSRWYLQGALKLCHFFLFSILLFIFSS